MQQPVTIEDLVSDETFIASCLGTNQDAVAYWKQKELQYPQYHAIFREARELVMALHAHGQAREIEEETEKLKALLHQPDEAAATLMTFPEESRRRRWRLPVAATIVMLAGISCFFILRKPSAVALVTVQTGTGEMKKVSLPDGSSVWLNAESHLQYREHFRQQREVALLEGEAYFDVVHDAEKPFSVVTPSGMRVLDIGTAFNVKSYTGLEEESIGVVTGEVLLSRSGHPEKNRLKAGEGGIVDKRSGSLRLMQYTAETAGWRNGNIVLNDVSFRELQLVLKNTYNIHLLFNDPTMANCRITTSFRSNEKITEILRTLKIVYGVSYTTRGDTILLKGTPCT
jgi:ferric-dicitrate binding protein FerR (iron transport regulator)